MFSSLFVFAIFFSVFTAQDNICDKYSKLLKITNKQLVQTVVNGTVAKVVAPASILKKYFDGTKPAGSTNFLAPENAGALKSLLEGLVAFFGAALSCPDGTIGPYTGPPLDKIHQPMGIAFHEFVKFNDDVIDTLAAAGVTDIDQVAVRILLNTLKSQIVVQNSICDRYSNMLSVTNKDLMTKVVVATVTGVTSPSAPTLKYFDGTKPPGSLNFLLPKNKNALDGVLFGLVTFFGQALGCSDGTLPPYGGPTLKNVHGIMGIAVDEFDFFNNVLIGVLRGAGVAQKDITTVHRFLNSTQPNIVS